jgi:hypothetical protein
MRFIPHLLWLSGLGLLIFAAGGYAGDSLPYQDPTPELLAVQQRQIQTAKIVAFVGILLFILGVALVFLRKNVSTPLR